MNEDLISRKKVAEFMFDNRYATSIDNAFDQLKSIPTAYNVDKVIKQIELLQDNEENDDMDTYEVKAAYSDAYIRSTDIIKAELIH